MILPSFAISYDFNFETTQTRSIFHPTVVEEEVTERTYYTVEEKAVLPDLTTNDNNRVWFHGWSKVLFIKLVMVIDLTMNH